MLLAKQLISGPGRAIEQTVSILFISLLVVKFSSLCSSRKHPYPPQRKLLKIPWGKGDLRKQLKKDTLKLHVSWNFQRIGRVYTKNNNFIV